MIRNALFALLLLLFAGCSSLQVQNDYNPDYDFSRLHTFAIVTPKTSNVVTLTQERLKRAIRERLEAKGYTQASKERADFLVMFHTDVTRMRQVVNDYESLGLYPYDYGYWGPAYIPSRYEYTYDEAKIVIDALDPKDKRVFWRGTATDLLRDFDTPAERIAYINGVVEKILAPFPAAVRR